MNRKEIIDNILDGSPTRMRISYFQKNHIDVLNEIEQFCKNIDVPFKQMIWHWVNDRPNKVLCSCGNPVKFNRNWLDGYKENCSPKCAQSKRSTKEKRRKTVMEKYGVDNIAKSTDIKEKQRNTNIERYGATSSFQNKHVRDKWKNTMLSKYGVDHYFKTDDFKEKSKETNEKKYGKPYFVQTDDYIEKTKQTMNDRFGVDWFSKTDQWYEMSKRTSEEKYGVDHYAKTDEYKEKVNSYYNEKYKTDWFFQTDEFKVKTKELMNEKFGVDHHTKSDFYKQKVISESQSKWGKDHFFQTDQFLNVSKKTMNEKYGVDHFPLSDQYKDIMSSDKMIEKRLSRRKLFYKGLGFTFISDSKNNVSHVVLKSEVCGHEFEIHPTTLQRRMDANIQACSVCNPFDTQSGQEKNVIEFIGSLGIDFVANKRDIIPPYEIDIYIPELKLAIEYNGLYWHSEMYRSRKFHIEKTSKCNESGIRLIHIWEDDWMFKNDIVRSIILNAVNKTGNRIYARKSVIKEVTDKKLVNHFFDSNHIQGKTNFKTAIGLFYDDEMVSCMLFHKPRKQHELVRFCNKKFHNVIGAASKLFKYYIKNYEVDEIISFADISMFTGGLYESLGFEFDNRSDVNYWWVVNGIRRHRFSFSKKKLVSKGYDENLSGSDIMRSLGNYKVFGCGLDKWVWNRN